MIGYLKNAIYRLGYRPRPGSIFYSPSLESIKVGEDLLAATPPPPEPPYDGQCNFMWYSNGQQRRVRCVHTKGHYDLHESTLRTSKAYSDGWYSFVAVGHESAVDGRWI